MKPAHQIVLLAALGLMLASRGAMAAEPPKSLNQARSEIVNGTSPGIVLIPARPKEEAPAAKAAAPVPAPAQASASAPAATSASRPATAATAAAAPAVAPVPAPAVVARQAVPPAAASSSAIERLGALLGSLGAPPSGEPLTAAKRHDSPSAGIVVPTAGGAASAPAGKSPAR